MRSKAGSVPSIFALFVLVGLCRGAEVKPTRVEVNGVELHYIEEGKGERLVLLHGGQGDYRSWKEQLPVFAGKYQVISYSRRYHYPNINSIAGTNHSPLIEAEDLAGLFENLNVTSAHLVGTSYGAFTALAFATKYPDKVATLVLSEPPIHFWARRTSEGEAEYQKFMTNIHNAVRTAFEKGGDEAGMKVFVDAIAGRPRYEMLSPEGKAAVLQNARFFRALTRSNDPYPNLSRDSVAKLRMPVLILTGAKTIPLHRIVNEELAATVPSAKHVIIPEAGHGAARENPQAFNEAVLEFLKQNIAE